MLDQFKRAAGVRARSLRDDWRRWAGAPAPALAAPMLDAVAALGIGAGDTVLLQVAPRLTPARPLSRRIGELGRRSFDAHLIDGICRIVGPQGLLAMPCQSVRDPKRLSVQGRRYDYRREQAHGAAGYLMCQAGAFSSASPILPVVAYGANAAAIVSGHLEAAPYPMGKSSPWWMLLGRGTKVVLIGEAVNVSLLLPANIDPAEYGRPSFFNRPFPFHVMDEAGVARMLNLHLHACPFQPRYDLAGYADFKAYMAHLTRQSGLYQSASVQGVEVTVFSLDEQVETQRAQAAAGIYLEDARYW
jgi:hypothetical protein